MSIFFNGNTFHLDIQDSVPVVVEETEFLNKIEEASSNEDEDLAENGEGDQALDFERLRLVAEEDEFDAEEREEREEHEDETDEEEEGCNVMKDEEANEAVEDENSRRLRPNRAPVPETSKSMADAATGSGAPQYILIQSKASLEGRNFQALKSSGVRFVEFLSGNAWLCRTNSKDLPTVGEYPFLKAVLLFPPGPKLPPHMKRSRLDDIEWNDFKSKEQTIVVKLHEENAETVASQICQGLNLDVDPITIVRNKKTIRVTVRGDQLEEIANLNHVRAVEEALKLKKLNNVARKILGFDKLSAGEQTKGTSFDGEGQIVTVADSGFDNGKRDGHQAFKGRVLELIAVEKANAEDWDGHGTHVCGSVLGCAQSDQLGGLIQGTAPKAMLIVQALDGQWSEETGESPFWENSDKTLADLLRMAYEYGSRIHNNSWGPGWSRQQEYTDDAGDLDGFVWRHREMIVCFAAGNDGKKKSGTGAHIGAYAAAKNCITVGSCDNERETDDNISYKADGSRRGNPDKISAFSSRGPTTNGRIKPDVVAPGSMILSTALKKFESDSPYGHWPEREWSFMSGTSMATPLVSGCVASIRGRLIEGQHPDHPKPSAALIKAVLINGAKHLRGQPRKAQGFGRVDMEASHRAISQRAFWEKSTRGIPESNARIPPTSKLRTVIPGKHGDGVLTDAWRWKRIRLKNYLNEEEKAAAKILTLKVTLVYMDKPGAILQIDLNLVVACKINNKWEYWRGNAKLKGLDRPWDSKNNVEQVVWKGLPADALASTIYVGTYKCDGIRQPKSFAVAWSVTPSTGP